LLPKHRDLLFEELNQDLQDFQHLFQPPPLAVSDLPLLHEQPEQLVDRFQFVLQRPLFQQNRL
jgi:hypothetical protein